MQAELSPNTAKNKIIQELALKKWFSGHREVMYVSSS